MLEVLKDILEFSKIEAGKLALDLVEFKPRDIPAIGYRYLDQRPVKKGIKLKAEVAPEVPEVLIGDPVRVRQVMFNLVGNAVKFTASGGVEIKVATEPCPAGEIRLRFTVSDTGVGIEAAKQKSIFEAFRKQITPPRGNSAAPAWAWPSVAIWSH